MPTCAPLSTTCHKSATTPTPCTKPPGNSILNAWIDYIHHAEHAGVLRIRAAQLEHAQTRVLGFANPNFSRQTRTYATLPLHSQPQIQCKYLIHTPTHPLKLTEHDYQQNSRPHKLSTPSAQTAPLSQFAHISRCNFATTHRTPLKQTAKHAHSLQQHLYIHSHTRTYPPRFLIH